MIIFFFSFENSLWIRTGFEIVSITDTRDFAGKSAGIMEEQEQEHHQKRCRLKVLPFWFNDLAFVKLSAHKQFLGFTPGHNTKAKILHADLAEPLLDPKKMSVTV